MTEIRHWDPCIADLHAEIYDLPMRQLQEVVEQLSKFNDIVVMESSPSATTTSVPPPRFVLSGSVDLSADSFRLRVRFTNRLDGSVLWADSYDGGIKVAELIRAQADIAHKVAMTLAPNYGVIFSAARTFWRDLNRDFLTVNNSSMR